MIVLREKVISEFQKYTSQYDLSNPKILLKVNHTYRVAQFCEEIAKSLSLNKEDIDLAWLCGMLHDIGRFEQVKRFGTFFDSQSVDHAQFGADLLFLEGLSDRFMEKKEREADLLEKAIRVHNQYRLPKDLSEREERFAHILRDADKIDILRVNYETPFEEVYNVPMEELLNSEVSGEVKEAFMEGRCAKRNSRTTAIDYLVGHICLSFELIFPKSRELLLEQGYVYKLLEFESNNANTRQWFAYMREHFEEKMNG